MMTADPPHSVTEIITFVKARQTEQVRCVCVKERERGVRDVRESCERCGGSGAVCKTHLTPRLKQPLQ